MSKTTWGTWLESALNERGWSQAEFVRQSGGHIKADRISKWLSGREVASHKFAIIAANTLGTSHAEALRAAGFVDAADEMDRRRKVLDGHLNIKGMSDGQLVEALKGVPDSAILRVLQLRATNRESLSGRATGVTQGNWSNVIVGGFAETGESEELKRVAEAWTDEEESGEDPDTI